MILRKSVEIPDRPHVHVLRVMAAMAVGAALGTLLAVSVRILVDVCDRFIFATATAAAALTDVCLGTDLNGPVPTSGTLRPNHLGDGTTTADGCNASQIIACMGGDRTYEQQYGVSPGIRYIFANRLGWAKDVNPADGIPDCVNLLRH